MEVYCPACHSTNTQRIIAPTAEGMIPSTSPGAGVDGEADDVYDTALIHTSPEPKLKADGNPMLGTLVLSTFGGWIPALTLYIQTGKLLSSLLVFAATICVIYVLIKQNVKRNRHYNQHAYPEERGKWENGFYCHDCEHIFALHQRDQESSPT